MQAFAAQLDEIKSKQCNGACARLSERAKLPLATCDRSKQGEGVVTYAEPLARSNEVMRRFYPSSQMGLPTATRYPCVRSNTSAR